MTNIMKLYLHWWALNHLGLAAKMVLDGFTRTASYMIGAVSQ